MEQRMPPRQPRLSSRHRKYQGKTYPYEDAEWIRTRYFDRQMTFVEIAAEAGCSDRTIAVWFKAHGFVAPHSAQRRRERGNLPSGNRNGRWAESDASISAAHRRVVAAFGRAAEHPCIGCGRPAAHWSYDHSDPDEKPSPVGPYSLDVNHYQPRCVSCHKRFDLAWLARSRGHSEAGRCS